MLSGKSRALIMLGAVVFGAASVAVCNVERAGAPAQAAIYTIYLLAAAFFAAAVWVLVTSFRRSALKEGLVRAAHKNAFTARLWDSYAYRTLVTGHVSLATNIFFALTKAAAGVYYRSAWLIALAFYYLILCVTKALVLKSARRRIPGETRPERQAREWRIYRLCGWLLLAITAALQGVVALIVKQGSAFSYRGVLIFAVAAYDFYCLTSSILYMARTRRRHSPVTVSVKTISFATSLIAMLTLQTAMFASFGGGAALQKTMNIATGTAVCVILIAWGALMVRRARKELKRLREELA